MTLRGKLINLIGVAAAAVAAYAAFGPIVETTYFRTDVGGEAEGLFLSETPTDFSSTTVNWLLAALVGAAIITIFATLVSVIRDIRKPAPTSREGSS